MEIADSHDTDNALSALGAAGALRARSLELLEFPAVLEQLASHAGFALGRREALALTPSSNAEAVAERQRETAEARLFLETGGVMEFGDAGDVSAEAQRAAKGGVLTGLELRAVAETLASGAAGPGRFPAP